MPRMTYGGTFGNKVLRSVSLLQQIKSDLTRAKAVADLIATGGATANLEGSAEFLVQTGQGSAFYNDLASLVSGVNAISVPALTDLDQG